MRRKAQNEQARVYDFQVGQIVVLYGRPYEESGRVVAIWPAIGEVDVEFPGGNTRICVEDLQIIEGGVDPPHTESVPGGAGTVSVPGGPPPPKKVATRKPDPRRVLALYWHSRDRKYRATKLERDGSSFLCPKCKEKLRRTVYKRRDGISDRLLACGGCVWLIRENDVEGCGPRPEPVTGPPLFESSLLEQMG